MADPCEAGTRLASQGQVGPVEKVDGVDQFETGKLDER